MGNESQLKTEKRQLRKEMRALRDTLPQKVREAESASVCRQLAGYLDVHPECRHIYAYYPLGSELDVLPLVQNLLDGGYEIAFPRVIRGESASAETGASEEKSADSDRKTGRSGQTAVFGSESSDNPAVLDMVFIRVRNLQSDFEEGSFHIMEPVLPDVVDWGDAIALVPGLCFDGQGHRLGYGKGYYDRYFSAHECGSLMGVCYSRLLLDEIPSEEHDLLMDRVWRGKEDAENCR